MNKKGKSLRDLFHEFMPSTNDIIETASKKLLKKSSSLKKLKSNFSKAITDAEKEAYSVYLKAQKHAWKKAVRIYCDENLDENSDFETFVELLQENFDTFDKTFMSISQSRKSRAGTTFEITIRSLFRKLDYPFDEQQIINGKPDFLMPSREYYAKNPLDCIVFTAKRTLRERWRQITTEGTKARGFFLATIDEDVSKNNLDQMRNNKIYLVVPAKLKQKIVHYADAPNVISFEDFFEDFLDPAMKRWKKAKAI